MLCIHIMRIQKGDKNNMQNANNNHMNKHDNTNKKSNKLNYVLKT